MIEAVVQVRLVMRAISPGRCARYRRWSLNQVGIVFLGMLAGGLFIFYFTGMTL
jgi:hypothetical protein